MTQIFCDDRSGLIQPNVTVSGYAGGFGQIQGNGDGTGYNRNPGMQFTWSSTNGTGQVCGYTATSTATIPAGTGTADYPNPATVTWFAATGGGSGGGS